MIDDLKHFRAQEEDAFQLLSGDECVMLLCILLFVGIVFRDYL